MEKVKEKLLEISDRIHEYDMEYNIYTREEFIKELKEKVTDYLAAESYLQAMMDKCDALGEEDEDTDYVAIRHDIADYMSSINEKILKDKKEYFWQKEKANIHVGDVFYNYSGSQDSVKFYKVVSVSKKTVKCQELETSIAKRSPSYAKPGSPIEGKFYIMKNETIRGEWCCPYFNKETVSQYLSKNPYKNY